VSQLPFDSVGQEPVSNGNPREWARPHVEGDPWHEYWDPAGNQDPGQQSFRFQGVVDSAPEPRTRERLARRAAVIYLASTPIAMVLSVLFSPPWSAAVGVVATAVAWVRIRWYGERAWGFTAAMVAFILVWAVIAAARIA
jgi:hypothetical protein